MSRLRTKLCLDRVVEVDPVVRGDGGDEIQRVEYTERRHLDRDIHTGLPGRARSTGSATASHAPECGRGPVDLGQQAAIATPERNPPKWAP